MLSELCIYTIKHTVELNRILDRGGHGRIKERKKWVTAKRLLDDAKLSGKRLPIIFAPAEDTSHLVAWAVLDEIIPDTTTTYRFSNLVVFTAPPRKTTLAKANGEPLAELYQRSYSICRTPDYLDEADVGGELFTTAQEFDLEGLKSEALRTVTKRSRRIRNLAFEAANGVCCVCQTDFSKVLGGRGIRVLQVHHRKQLSARKCPVITAVEDLAVVCANCHLLLHHDPEHVMKVETLRKMLLAK